MSATAPTREDRCLEKSDGLRQVQVRIESGIIELDEKPGRGSNLQSDDQTEPGLSVARGCVRGSRRSWSTRNTARPPSRLLRAYSTRSSQCSRRSRKIDAPAGVTIPCLAPVIA